MLRLATIALIASCAAVTSATSTAVACQSISISPLSGSLCKSVSGSVCATAAMATATQAAASLVWSAVTSTTATAAGTAACTAAGGTLVNSFWTNPALWNCASLPPCPSTCGSTATSAPVTATPAMPYCCASIRSCISSACSGIANIATIITPSGIANGTSALFSSQLGLPTTCADSACQNWTCASASGVTYSVLAVLLAALLALFQF